MNNAERQRRWYHSNIEHARELGREQQRRYRERHLELARLRTRECMRKKRALESEIFKSQLAEDRQAELTAQQQDPIARTARL